MRIVSRSSAEQGTCSLGDVAALIQTNSDRAKKHGVELRWRHKRGVYWGISKKDGFVVFERPYPGMLVFALVNMHLDFKEFLDGGNWW